LTVSIRLKVKWFFFRTALVVTDESVGSQLRDLRSGIAIMESSFTTYMIPAFDGIGFTTIVQTKVVSSELGALVL
jgi:hypothetical protein